MTSQLSQLASVLFWPKTTQLIAKASEKSCLLARVYSSVAFVITLMANVTAIEQSTRNISLEAPYIQILKSRENPIQILPDYV